MKMLLGYKANLSFHSIKLYLLITFLLFILFCINSVTCYAYPLCLNYSYSPDSNESNMDRFVGVGEYINSSYSNSAYDLSYNSSFPYVADVSVLISNDRETATFYDIEMDFIDGPVVVNDFFDLGFYGQVPYTLTVTEGFVSSNPFNLPLAIDGSFQSYGTFNPLVTVIGSVDILGETYGFSYEEEHPRQATFHGDFDLLQQSSEVELTLNFGIDFDQSDLIIYAGTYMGNDLNLELHTHLSGNRLGSEVSSVNPVPEPSTIVLMGLGLVGLAGFGRKKFKK